MKAAGRVTRLIIWLNALVAAYSLLAAFRHWPDFPQEWMRLEAGEFFDGYWWEPFTCMWLHVPFVGMGVLHILFNMTTLAGFGQAVERELGWRRYLVLYLVCGLVSSFAFVAEAGLRWWWLGQTQILDVPVMGASGAIFGVVAAFAVYYPDVKLYVMLIPVPIRALTAIRGAIVLSVLFIVTQSFGFVAHSAHLGGALAGLALATWLFRKKGVVTAVADPEVEGMGEDELRLELPRVLEKITSQGVWSLSERERKILDRGRTLFR